MSSMERHKDLRKGSVVPDVSVVGEAVPHKAETTTSDILLDRIERLLLGYLHLCVGPSRDFNDHVQYVLVLVGKKGDVVEGRLDTSIFFDVNAVI